MKSIIVYENDDHKCNDHHDKTRTPNHHQIPM